MSRKRAQRQVSASVPALGQQRQHLHAPQRAGDSEQAEGVGDQRVDRAVGRVDLLPVLPDVVIDRIVGDRDRPVGVGVEAVFDAYARVGDVAEDVGRQQDRSGEDDRVQRHDQRDRPAFGDASWSAATDRHSPPRRPARRSGRRGSRGARRCPAASRRSPATWGSGSSAQPRRRARSRRWRRAAPAHTPSPAPEPIGCRRVCVLARVRSARRRSRRRAAHKAVQTVFVSR